MPASKGVRFIEWPDADTALYESSYIIDVTLKRVDQLITRQSCVLGHRRAIGSYSRCLGLNTGSARHVGCPSLGIYVSHCSEGCGIDRTSFVLSWREGAKARIPPECGGVWNEKFPGSGKMMGRRGARTGCQIVAINQEKQI